jgi:hypothetical protein
MFGPASPSPSFTLPQPLPLPAHRAVCYLALVDIAEFSFALNPEPNTSPSVDDLRPAQPLDVHALASPALASQQLLAKTSTSQTWNLIAAAIAFLKVVGAHSRAEVPEVLKSVQTLRLPLIIAGLLFAFFASQKIVFSIISKI